MGGSIMTPEKYRDVGMSIARGIGTTAAKMPAGTFLIAAMGSLAASAALRWAGKKSLAIVVGELMPTILLFTLYRKTAHRMAWPPFQQELRPGSPRWEGPPQEPVTNASAAATPGVPL